MDQQRTNPLITFGGRQFDPAASNLHADDDRVKGPDGPWFVQLAGGLDADTASDLHERYGLRLVDYVPEHAYVEWLSGRRALELLDDPRIRAVAPYEPDHKVAPELIRADLPDPVGVRVQLFDGAQRARVEEELTRLGAHVPVRAATGHTIQITIDRARLADVPRLPAVRWIEPIPEGVDDGPAMSVGAGTAAVFTALWAAGLHGEGEVIGVLDNDLPDLDHCFFRDADAAAIGPAHRKVAMVRNATGHDAFGNIRIGPHAMFVAGCAAGDDVRAPGSHPDRGGAWAARLALGNRNDLDVFGGPSTLDAELAAAAAAGARIHSNSWHVAPQRPRKPAIYDGVAVDVDAFCWRSEDHLVVGSSGNATDEQGAPGTAKNALCVAAATANALDARLGDGAPGPTADLRRKPDLMAVGCGIRSALPSPPDAIGPRSPCASSYATPFVAAAAALVRQYFIEGRHPSGVANTADAFTPSGALLKAVLINSAVATSGVSGYPTDAAGWGLMQQGALHLGGASRQMLVVDVRNGAGLRTGETRSYDIPVTTDREHLAVTLVWTDAPGTAGTTTNPAVNDLDLDVVSPDGVLLRGNHFVDGQSAPGGEPDKRNNVEVVLVREPVAGTWTVSITASAVNRAGTQGFALVASSGVTDG
jgi:hypothetical protein